MKAITVGTTPMPLAPYGNRDFLNIYNNDSATIFIAYDGGEFLSDSVVKMNQFGWANGESVIAIYVESLTGISVDDFIYGPGIPAGKRVVSLNNNNGVFTIVVSFTASANSSIGDYIGFASGSAALTVDTGWPVPAGNQLYLSNDGNRNLYNQAVWAISAAGGANVRIQGA